VERVVTQDRIHADHLGDPWVASDRELEAPVDVDEPGAQTDALARSPDR
jgi:hypothetical protein